MKVNHNIARDEPPRHKEHQEDLEVLTSGRILHFISDEVSDASSERCSSLISLGDLGVLVV
jgi:hypothetical protein